jgi:hypothetical protein
VTKKKEEMLIFVLEVSVHGQLSPMFLAWRVWQRKIADLMKA